jgi:hypothetical protein
MSEPFSNSVSQSCNAIGTHPADRHALRQAMAGVLGPVDDGRMLLCCNWL